MERTILHVDLNNFFASVECLFDPSLQNKPVAVAGDVQARHGIVLAKNMEAKRRGVQTAEPLWAARRKCPEIVFVPPHYDRYVDMSRKAREIYSGYTDQIEPFGLDECWMDVTGSRWLFGSGRDIADDIRRSIRTRLGVTVSVGVSFNKVFAKLGSDMKKPDATTVILPEDYRRTVWLLPVEELLFAGHATTKMLNRMGIRTIGDLARAQPEYLLRQMGQNGLSLWRFANGLDMAPVLRSDACVPPKSIGNGTTTPRDLTDDRDVRAVLHRLSESVSARLREQDYVCRTVKLGIRDCELHSIERQMHILPPDRTEERLFAAAYSLYRTHHTSGKAIRSLSVRACDLEKPCARQLTFLDNAAALERRERLESVIDGLRSRFGSRAVQRGIMGEDVVAPSIDPSAHPSSLPGDRAYL